MTLNLSDHELVILDGQCSETVQQAVDAAKQRLAAIAALPQLTEKQAGFVADVVREARENGKLTFRFSSIRSCPLCERKAGYAVRTRRSAWARAGTPNYDKPLYLSGIELAERFLSVKGYVSLGCCRECMDFMKPFLTEALADVRAEIPENITGHAPRFLWYRNQHCTKCEWSGHEGQMGFIPAVFQGKYRGKCPQCGAENLFLGPTIIKSIDGFTVVESGAPVSA